jgi:hypothetical protein
MRDPITTHTPDAAIVSPAMESTYQRRCLREGYWRSSILSTRASRAAARLLRKLIGGQRHA